jgi:threonine dehydrogenase-like Zn-dependent dehydrogenase
LASVLDRSRSTASPTDDLIPSPLATSDVLEPVGSGGRGTRSAWLDVAVVGAGAVGLMGVLSAKQMGAERIIIMSRHKKRQELALEYGSTDVISERGEVGMAQIS